MQKPNLKKMNPTSEIWKDIEGEPHYQVSNLGNVRSVDHYGYCGRAGTVLFRGRLRKPQAHHKNGYMGVMTGKFKLLSVHRCVAKAFIPNPENKPQVNHKNGIRSDNRVENLEWVTISENNQHAWDVLGRVCAPHDGENNPKAKLNNEKVRQIRARCDVESRVDLANEFGVSPTTISGIALGKFWRNVA